MPGRQAESSTLWRSGGGGLRDISTLPSVCLGIPRMLRMLPVAPTRFLAALGERGRSHKKRVTTRSLSCNLFNIMIHELPIR